MQLRLHARAHEMLCFAHIHGAYGAEADSGTKESLDTMSRFEASQGVTTFAPTIRTLSLADIKNAIK